MIRDEDDSPSDLPPARPVPGYGRRLIAAVYLSGCALILMIGVALLYFGQPKKFNWSLVDVHASEARSYRHGPDDSDWTLPVTGCQLLNFSSARFDVRKRFIDFASSSSHWGYRNYYRIRMDDSGFAARLEAAPKSGYRANEDSRKNHGAPRPGWWNPTESVTVEINGSLWLFFLNPNEPGIVYAIREWEVED